MTLKPGWMRNIVVVAYDPAWLRAFEDERARLEKVFAGSVTIHHIGSTSVPGLSAKPVIDILLAVDHLDDVDARNDAMTALGYQVRGELGIPGRRYFSKGGDEKRTHNVHAYEHDHAEVGRHLAFRDYLRAHADEARRYGAMKQQAAAAHRDDIDGYMAAKAPMIAELLERATADAAPRHEQANVHLRVLGETRVVSFPVPLGPSPLDGLLPMARALNHEGHSAAVESVEAEGKALSCAKGCDACCHSLVPMSPLEARRLAAVVKAMPASQRDEVRQRFDEARAQMQEAGIDVPASADVTAWRAASERYRAAKIPCPLLEDSVCRIYDERPMVCASYGVTSPAERCSTRGAPLERIVQPLAGAGLLTATVNALSGHSFGPVPIPLALEWDQRHGAELDLERDGEAMFWELTKQVDRRANKAFDDR
jgi:GrpB-like predicted nucleotidyltransferase (UPF0157 family)/Fe-S-cluster containining protein